MAESAVSETAAIIGWLSRNPNDRSIILSLASIEERLLPWQEYGASAPRKADVEKFLEGMTFGPCYSCFQPTVSLPDWRVLDWPSFATHKCQGMGIEGFE